MLLPPRGVATGADHLLAPKSVPENTPETTVAFAEVLCHMVPRVDGEEEPLADISGAETLSLETQSVAFAKTAIANSAELPAKAQRNTMVANLIASALCAPEERHTSPRLPWPQKEPRLTTTDSRNTLPTPTNMGQLPAKIPKTPENILPVPKSTNQEPKPRGHSKTGHVSLKEWLSEED